jgi:uncharacterized membrane protein
MKARIDTVLIAGAALWCAAIIVAPLAPSASLGPVYAFFSLICHQEPERSWMLFGHPLPVCIRCSGIYFGFLLALMFRRQPAVVWLKVALALTVSEVAMEWLVVESVLARTITALILGAAIAPFVRVGVEEMLGAPQSNAL